MIQFQSVNQVSLKLQLGSCYGPTNISPIQLRAHYSIKLQSDYLSTFPIQSLHRQPMLDLEDAEMIFVGYIQANEVIV